LVFLSDEGEKRGNGMTIAERLLAEGHAFDFFQAVRLLERLYPKRRPVGHPSLPKEEVVRFRSHLSLAFPASTIYEIVPPVDSNMPLPQMTVTFLGLYGPSGVLPRHYTELMMRLERDVKGPERRGMRDWLDLFNHRLIALFFRAWEKYRFPIHYERGGHKGTEPDPFTRALFSLIGLGIPPLRNRLRVSAVEQTSAGPRESPLAEIDDLGLLHYSGLLVQRPRTAIGLEALIDDYFGLPVRVGQFLGCWLQLEPANQSQLGQLGCELGVSVVVGTRVWDVQSKIRLRLGPLRRDQFDAFLPDPSPLPQRKAFFLLVHLVRLYLGPELDFDVQLVLRAPDVPGTHLDRGGLGPRLGWNTWILTENAVKDAEDAVFEGQVVRWLGTALTG
jgi:type VI secretion system protein ImpH